MSVAPNEAKPAEASRPAFYPFLLLLLQFGLVLQVLDSFQVESRAFLSLALLAFPGFLVHSYLPLKYRPPFFVLLSLGGILLVMGPRNGFWLVSIGLGLIALCHLPVPFKARVAAVIVAGASLAAFRADWLHAPWSGAIWPILGSMFMFRLIIYLYDLRHRAAEFSLWKDLSYFFLLPNVCFALFPVVDYKTFRRTYYDHEDLRIYQNGFRWMLRGIVHLLAYRFVYYYGTLAPEEVESAAGLLRYCVANFALYLRLSGVFHLVIGLLCLFGFNLPETHHNYFLSSSINDFWRRINIYWKDFMLKLFYYPAFFRLRKRGATQALIVATLFVVLVTWALHSYQWFWLRGGFPIHWQDGVFWGALGILMVFNTVYESRHARARGRRARSWTGSGVFGQGLRIAATFSFICLLWSVWTAKSWAEWLSLWSFLGNSDPRELATLLSLGTLGPLFVGLALSGGRSEVAGEGGGGSSWFRRKWGRQSSLASQAWANVGALALIALLGIPAFYSRLGPAVIDFCQSMRLARLNRIDAASLQRGYYEDLLNVERFNSELWMVYKSKPQEWMNLADTLASTRTGDFLMRELVPSVEIQFKGAPLKTNSWGMRDRDYAREPAPGTKRIALLGASYVMGPGVTGDETFEAVLEQRLNTEGPDAEPGRYEILNFSVAGYSPLQRLIALERKGLDFHPGWAIYVAHENDVDSLLTHLMAAHEEGLRPPYPYLEGLFATLEIDARTSDVEFERRVRGHAPEILTWIYGRFAEACRENGIEPLWIYLPTIEMLGEKYMMKELADGAAASGFTVIDLTGVYDGHDVFGIILADWDFHPNARGHKLIADRIFAELEARNIFADKAPGADTQGVSDSLKRANMPASPGPTERE